MVCLCGSCPSVFFGVGGDGSAEACGLFERRLPNFDLFVAARLFDRSCPLGEEAAGGWSGELDSWGGASLFKRSLTLGEELRASVFQSSFAL